MVKPVTTEEITEIRYLREIEELEIKEIAEITGVNHRRIDYIILKYLKYRKRKNFSDEEKEIIIKLFKQGYTKEQIATKTGRTFYSISSFLTKYNGFTNSYRIVRKNNFLPWSESEEKYILDNYSTKTAVELAKDLNRTPLGIRTRIIKMRRENKGIVSKPLGGYNKNFVDWIYKNGKN